MLIRDYVRKTLYVTILLSFFLYFPPVGTASATPTTAEGELHVTFKLKQTPMTKVVDMITTQTGYTVTLEEKLENLPVSGEFTSVEVTSFFKQALKGKNLFIIISPKVKTITVRMASNSKVFNLATNTPENKPRTTDKSRFEEPGKVYEDSKILPGIELGGVYELDNNFPPTISGDNGHITDPQTGKPWKEVEELLK